VIKKLLITAVVLAALAAAVYLFGGPVSRRISAWLHPANDDPVPTLSLQPRDYRVVVSAQGALTGLDTVPINTPSPRSRSRWSLKIAWLVPEGTLLPAGSTLVRFDRSEAALALEQNRNTVTSYDHRLDKNSQDARTDTRLVELDQTGADQEYEFARRQIRKDEDIFSRWEIQESIMNAALAQYRKGVLARKGELRGTLNQADQKILGIERGRAQAEVQSAEEILSSLEIQAPVPGVVIYRESWFHRLEVGGEVWPGQPLMDIASLSSFKGKIQVAEASIAGVKEGAPVGIRIASLSDQDFTGRVVKVARVAEQIVDEDPRKYFECEIALDVPPDVLPRLKPGLRLTAEIETARQAGAFVVPKCAVIKKDNRFLVYVRDARNGYRERPVTIVDSDHGFFVLDGVRGGDVIALRHPYEKQQLHLPDFNAASTMTTGRRFIVIG